MNNKNEEENEKVKDIIIELVSEEDDGEIDMNQVISLADRINNNLHERKEALFVLEDIFKNAPSNMILKAVKVLETLVKNCGQNFHYDVASKDFQESILKLLDRKRGKKGFFKTIKQNVKNWEIIESKVLYLIQLWYDTFMMHEGDFPHIMNNYKVLRKEGIKFPERDNNEIHMINFKGIKSPIFQVLEEQQMQKTGVVPKNKREQLITKPAKSDYAQKFELSQQNLDKLADNLQIIGAIIDGAQQPEDFQTDFAQDIIMFLKSFKTKIMLLNAQKQIDDLGDKKKEIFEFYKQTRIVIKNFESKSQEIEQLHKVMQESAIEEFSKIAEKTNYVKKLKSLNIAPPPAQGGISKAASTIVQNTAKIEPMEQQKQAVQSSKQQKNDENMNNQNIQNGQNNNIDLLDFDFDQITNTSPPQLIQNQQGTNIIQQNSYQNNPTQVQQQVYQTIPIPPQPIQHVYNQNVNNDNYNGIQNNQFQIKYQQSQMQQIQQQNIQQKINDDLDLFSDFQTQPISQPQQLQQQQVQKQEDDFWDEISTRK